MKRFKPPVLDAGAFVSTPTVRTAAEIGPTITKDGYVRLWKAVLAQLIVDAKSNSAKKANHKIKQEALNFLLSDNEDFRVLCELASIDPDLARKYLVKYFTNN